MYTFKWSLAALLLFSSYIQAEDFTPNGSIEFTQTFYGDAGKYKTSTSHPSVQVNYNVSSDWSAEIGWDRAWNMYNYTGLDNQQDNNLSQPKLVLTNNHGKLATTHVKWSSSFSFENQNSFNGFNSYYSKFNTAFDLSELFTKNKYWSVTQFSVSPMYIYGWQPQSESGHTNTGVLSLLTNWTLPNNFSFTFNAYAFRDWYNGSMIVSNSNNNYSNTNYLMLMAWLNYSNNIHEISEKTKVIFNFTGGLDPYISSNKKATWYPFLASDQMYEWLSPVEMNGSYRNTYTLFALPQITLSHQYDKNFSLSTFFQIKYSNQVWGDNEKNWRLQPQTGFGMNYNF